MNKSTITGFRDLELSMQELQDKIQRGAMRTALTKAARPMTAAAKRNAPVGATGLLKKSIKQKIITGKKKDKVITALIGPSTKVVGQVDRFGSGHITNVRPSLYAHLVEFGTAARGSYGRKGVVISPGNPPKPFLRPAYEQGKDKATTDYKNELAPAIEQAAARIGRAKKNRKS